MILQSRENLVNLIDRLNIRKEVHAYKMKIDVKRAKEKALEKHITDKLKEHYIRGLREGVVAFSGTIKSIADKADMNDMESIKTALNEIVTFANNVLPNKSEEVVLKDMSN